MSGSSAYGSSLKRNVGCESHESGERGEGQIDLEKLTSLKHNCHMPTCGTCRRPSANASHPTRALRFLSYTTHSSTKIRTPSTHYYKHRFPPSASTSSIHASHNLVGNHFCEALLLLRSFFTRPRHLQVTLHHLQHEIHYPRRHHREL